MSGRCPTWPGNPSLSNILHPLLLFLWCWLVCAGGTACNSAFVDLVGNVKVCCHA